VTLTELLVAAAILMILASMALPIMQKTTELGYLREAEDVLMAIYTGERRYFFQNDEYKMLNEGDPNDTWRLIGLDNPNMAEIPVAFSVPVVDGQKATATFTAQATRLGGDCNGKFKVIKADRIISGDWVPPSC